MAYKVFINAGHGGNAPGAVSNGLKEKDVNLTIALSCEEELKRHGVEVKMQRTTDMGTSSDVIASNCNNYHPDLAVDIHNNAGGGDGAEVFYSYKGGVDKTLAANILNEMTASGQNSRGAKTKRNVWGRDYFHFIREIFFPSVIVECAFLDNKNDVQIIDTEAEQKAMGVAIAKGILKTLGVSHIGQFANATQPKRSVVADGVAYYFDRTLAGTYTVTEKIGLYMRHSAGYTKKKMVAIPWGYKVRCYGYYSKTLLGAKWLYVQITYMGVTYTGFMPLECLRK